MKRSAKTWIKGPYKKNRDRSGLIVLLVLLVLAVAVVALIRSAL